jgi:hypothetical protein
LGGIESNTFPQEGPTDGSIRTQRGAVFQVKIDIPYQIVYNGRKRSADKLFDK